MHSHDLRGYPWDVANACRKLQAFSQSKTLTDYLADDLLRSAVERQLTIVGEALAQAERRFPDGITHISNTRQIIAFRNRIVHAYLQIDDPTVWGIVEDYVPRLLAEAEDLLSQLNAENDAEVK